jgi:hypothetical protein
VAEVLEAGERVVSYQLSVVFVRLGGEGFDIK